MGPRRTIGTWLAASLFAAVIAVGCGGEPAPTPRSDTSTPPSGDPAAEPSSATGRSENKEAEARPVVRTEGFEGNAGDFSTAQAAIDTFIAASAARDLEVLSRCFADNAPREFDGLRKKTATPEELDELAEMMQGARVTDVRIKSAGTAIVDVKLSRRDERISMRKTDAGWKIVDF